MDDDALLNTTPEPHPDESPIGYWQRLAEENRYKKLSIIFSLVGRNALTAEDIFYACGALHDLCALTGMSSEVLGPLLYRLHPSTPEQVLIQGHSIYRLHLDVSHPKACPLCLREGEPYRRRLWDLSLFVVCPRHGVWLVSACPRCGVRHRWSETRITGCRRHPAALIDVKPTYCTDELRALVDFIQAAFDGKRVGSRPDGWPLELQDLPPSDLLDTIVLCRNLAARDEFSRRQLQSGRVDKIVCAAAHAFSHWPYGFRRGSRFRKSALCLSPRLTLSAIGQIALSRIRRPLS